MCYFIRNITINSRNAFLLTILLEMFNHFPIILSLLFPGCILLYTQHENISFAFTRYHTLWMTAKFRQYLSPFSKDLSSSQTLCNRWHRIFSSWTTALLSCYSREAIGNAYLLKSIFSWNMFIHVTQLTVIFV